MIYFSDELCEPCYEVVTQLEAYCGDDEASLVSLTWGTDPEEIYDLIHEYAYEATSARCAAILAWSYLMNIQLKQTRH